MAMIRLLNTDLPRIDLPRIDLPRIDLPRIDLPSIRAVLAMQAATLAAIVMIVLAQPAAAQADADGLYFSPEAIERCFADGGTGEDCVGASAAACMEDTPGGYSTYAMAGCFSRELDYWDAALNTAYQTLMEQMRATDADYADLPEDFNRATSLRQMQRGWIAYRDGRCAYERSLWGNGTGASPAGVSCLMAVTARQALYLEEQLGME